MAQRRIRTAFLAAALFCLAACADYTNAKVLNDPEIDTDPYEGFNRVMFAINDALDTVIIRPVTVAYRYVMPEPGRKMVDNFVNNLGSPVIFANSVLQGDQKNSFATFWRFTLNTTIGIGGLFDVASEAGLRNRPADFGQTLYVWGVPSGPYTYAPIFGPGTERDTFGRFVDLLFNPTVWISPSWYSYAQAGITIVDRRSVNYRLIEDINNSSLDPYATYRSLYLQKRLSDLKQADQCKVWR